MEKHYRETLHGLEIKPVIEHYEQYRDAGAIEKLPTLNYPDIRKANEDIILNNAPVQKLDTTLEALLKQPVMAEEYVKQGIQPEDVPAYIESVKKMPDSHKKTMLQSFVGAYGIAALNMEGEKEPIVNGSREWIALLVQVDKADAVTKSMQSFVESQKPIAKEVNLWGKLAEKFGYSKELDKGYNENIRLNGVPHYTMPRYAQSNGTEYNR